MNKLYPFALALAAVVAIPTSAMAWDDVSTFDVTIVTRDREVDVGTMRFRFAEAGEGLDESGGFDDDDLETCRFFVSWTSANDAKLRTNLLVDQIAPVSFADCEENIQDEVNTILFLADDETNRGFDRYQQRREVEALILAQTDSGEMAGVIQFENSGVFSIRLD